MSIIVMTFYTFFRALKEDTVGTTTCAEIPAIQPAGHAMYAGFCGDKGPCKSEPRAKYL